MSRTASPAALHTGFNLILAFHSFRIVYLEFAGNDYL